MRPHGMKRPHHVLRIVCLVLLLAPIAVTSTPPSLPPYHQYRIDGHIERAGGGTLEGFAIVLIYKRKTYDGPTDWVRGGTPDLTDDRGRFQVLSGEFYFDEVDSLSTAMVTPDTVIVGAPFPASEDPGTPIKSFHTHAKDGFICDDVDSVWEVDGYAHYYTDKTFPLP
jgi:hypothetical protein